MQVLRAKTAGFCMGVSNALRKLNAVLEEQKNGEATAKNLATFGPIIHNPQVLEEYAAQGVACYENVREVPKGTRLVIRAHGIPRQVEEALIAQGAEIIDATCPRVKAAQLGIARYCADGYSLLLYGEPEHPEVAGLMSYAGENARVFSSVDEAKKISLDAPQGGVRYVLAAQTTQDTRGFTEIEQILRERLNGELAVLTTICHATEERQDETREIVKSVDAMVVVGGKASGNTRRLAAVAKTGNVPTYHVETVDELRAELFAGMHKIGLTAGASTPHAIIDAVEYFLGALPE